MNGRPDCTTLVQDSRRPLLPAILLSLSLCAVHAQQKTTTANAQISERPAVHVDPVNLTEVQVRILNRLNLGAVISSTEVARGVQKAADVWGLHVDLFDGQRPAVAIDTASRLVSNGAAVLILDSVTARAIENNATALEALTTVRADGSRVPIIVVGPRVKFATTAITGKSEYQGGFDAVRSARVAILPLIPKFDELFGIIFPITPLPDSFFQVTKFPYPEPVIRSVRTVSSHSASAHAHTSCHAGALLGNMIHRTSKADSDVFLLGFEGGNLAIKARPGAVTPDKLSAVMTAYVIAFRGNAGERRDLLSENDGVETSAFVPSVHVPEELDQALTQWRRAGMISDFARVGTDEVILKGFKGADRKFRAGFFIVSHDVVPREPMLEPGVDGYGRWMFEMTSTQGFKQLFGEVPMVTPKRMATKPEDLVAGLKLASSEDIASIPSSGAKPIGLTVTAPPSRPRGGVLVESGAMVGSTVGMPLGSLLRKVDDPSARFQPYVLTIEGGFLVVTPDRPLMKEHLVANIRRIDIDERGPLGSDQTISITLTSGSTLVLRRSTLSFAETDRALHTLQQQALISGWEYVGARGQGLAANLVLHNFLGKHRKFMSSLNTWPSSDRTMLPYVRWYVDGMQRLNFSVVLPGGWRQEFVEVPVRVTPIPRDVQLFSGVTSLD